MPDVKDVKAIDNSVIPSPSVSDGLNKMSARGPRYNEDIITLEEGVDDEFEDEGHEKEGTEDKPKGKEGKRPDKNLEGDEKGDDESDSEDGDKIEDEEEEEPVKIPFDRPTIKDIKAKYPEIFKDFPELKEAFFREAEFTKFFPTVDDAREAHQENEAFTVLQESVLSGDPIPLLDSVEKTDSKAFEILSLSFLPSLYKKNQDLYSQAVTPLFQNLVRTLHGDRDENVRNAALVIADYLFGSDGAAIAEGKKSVAKILELTAEQKKIKDEKESSSAISFRNSAGRVEDTIIKSIESLVFKNPSYDPNKVFSTFLRKQGAQEIVKRIMDHLGHDQGHLSVMAARWKRARANGYTSDDESKIISTYLARAKPLIPDACSKVSAAMLGTKSKAADDRRDKTKTYSRENHSGKESDLKGNGRQPEKVDYSKMTDLEILNS